MDIPRVVYGRAAEVSAGADMMALSQDDKREIKEMFHDCLCEHYKAYGLDSAQHSKDHAFIRDWRDSTSTLKRAGIWVSITVVFTGLLGLLWVGIKQSMGGQ
jgi:hypothetical protein